MGLYNTFSMGLGQDQEQHPAVHTGELVVGGSVAVVLALVTCDR